jgi:hypothetical protein
MAASKKITQQQQRDKRAKIVLGVLGGVFLLVVGFEVMSMSGGKGSPPAAAPPTTAGATTSGATTPATTAPAGASSGSYEVVAALQPGQLKRFSRLPAKNPFQPLVSGGTAGTGGQVTPGTTPTTPASGKSAPPSVVLVVPKAPTSTTPQGPMVLAAVLKLNGHSRVIAVGDSFPKVNPVFKLIAVGKGAMWIQLIGGSLAGGDTTLKITRNHPVKLVNETVGINYLLRMIRVTTVHQPLQPATTTTATTTNASTTTSSTTTTNAAATTTSQ